MTKPEKIITFFTDELDNGENQNQRSVTELSPEKTGKCRTFKKTCAEELLWENAIPMLLQ
jgi:hypothetical protein